MSIYRSCEQLEKCSLIISMNIGDYQNCLSPCCYSSMLNKGTTLTDNPLDDIKNFLEYRHNMIEENKRVYQTDNKERIYTSHCEYCVLYKVKDWADTDSKLNYVNLSMYPSPCQSKCIYCNFMKNENVITDKAKDAYIRLFDTIKYIKENNLVTYDAEWQVSPGEITIHPYKQNIFDLVYDVHDVIFFTNCFVFNQDIANILGANKYARMMLSIDSGTAITWKKIKGFNNFNTVLNNLYKYYQHCDQINYQQIELKYILMLGINTRIQDYNGVIEIMKKFSIKSLHIARNYNDHYESSSPEYKELFNQIINLAVLCINNGISFELDDGLYSDDERDYINKSIKQIV